jgi:hypothetical protein
MTNTQDTTGYKVASTMVSVLGGMLAGAAFSRLWRMMAGEQTPPAPDSTEHRTSEVLVAAALQGAVTGAVRAAVQRAGARGMRAVADSD